MPAVDITVQFDGKSYEIDDFSLGELEWLEEYIGGRLNDSEAMESMKAAVGIATVIKRRDDPAFTVEQARDLKLKVLDQGSAPNGNGKRPTKAAGRSRSAARG